MKSDQTIYRGVRDFPGERVTVDGNELALEPSLKLRNHSPTGFAWGYAGSGPSQLALAVLLDFTGDETLALFRYMEFKREFVSGWDLGWEIDGLELRRWLERQQAAQPLTRAAGELKEAANKYAWPEAQP
ncbi:MAG TPA: DUF6166 domain-containing protein [Tepidisphaeraceae bacterium]|jgi:hypothetical protein|nr:DUF6166 domain-containing protein [Tepidisphaeraceae bacterium]